MTDALGPSAGACVDCGRRYGDRYGFPDMHVPDDVWARISPTGDDGGLLCPSCICRRAHAAGIICEAVFKSGPFADQGVARPTADQWQPIETAPKAGAELLTWNGRRWHVSSFDRVEDEWVSSFRTTTRRLVVAPRPTHWMPLPKPPAAGGADA